MFITSLYMNPSSPRLLGNYGWTADSVYALVSYQLTCTYNINYICVVNMVKH